MSKSTTTKEIREQLSRYLTGELEPAEFREWFALVLRDAPTDSAAETLAHEIEWLFADFETGSRSALQLREGLEFFVSDVVQDDSAQVPPLDVNWVEMEQLLFAAPADRGSLVVYESVDRLR